MKRLYETNELLFTLVIAIVNWLLYLIGQELSWIIGIHRLVTAVITIFEIAFIYLWIKKNGLKEKYGFCRFAENKGGVNRYLYAIPLVILVAIHFVRGIQINFSIQDTILFIIVNMGIGFMEEIIYRGFLFKALCKYDVGLAIILSSDIFGAIHLIHLFWGQDIIVTLMQVCYASAVGILFCFIFYESKSIWPCIVTHGLINSCGAFVNKETTLLKYCGVGMVMCIVSIFFSIYFLETAGSNVWEFKE